MGRLGASEEAPDVPIAFLTSTQLFSMFGFKRKRRETTLLETMRLDALPPPGAKCSLCRSFLGRSAETAFELDSARVEASSEQIELNTANANLKPI